MATRTKPVWVTFCGHYSAGGERDVFILGSIGDSQSPDVVSQCSVVLTKEDQGKLANQGVPQECRDDLSIMKARVGLDDTYELVGVEVSKSGKELSCNFVLKCLAELMEKTNKPGGRFSYSWPFLHLVPFAITVLIYYFGNGKRNTGDWCFKDGFITFRDIASLYQRFFCGGVLTIITDCSHSGCWVKDCTRYLDEQGVKPCGHSANANEVLLKVYASCRPGDVAATPCFSVQGVRNDKNTGQMSYYINTKLRENQHSFGINFTDITCGSKIEESCALSPNFSWQNKSDGERVYLVRGKDGERPAWHYVLLVDDEETIKKFKEALAIGTVDVAKFGQILKSGWGEDPPNTVRDEMDRKYKAVYT